MCGILLKSPSWCADIRIGWTITGKTNIYPVRNSKYLTIAPFTADPFVWCRSSSTHFSIIRGIKIDVYIAKNMTGRYPPIIAPATSPIMKVRIPMKNVGVKRKKTRKKKNIVRLLPFIYPAARYAFRFSQIMLFGLVAGAAKSFCCQNSSSLIVYKTFSIFS